MISNRQFAVLGKNHISPEYKKSRKSAQIADLREPKPFTRGPSTTPNLSPSANNFVCAQEKGNIWSISVVSHTCRVIYITSLAQNIKISKICSDRDLREAKPSPLSDEMCQISATDALESRWAPRIRLRKINVIVVGHIYQFIYVTSSAKNVKKLQNLPSSFKQHLKPLSNSQLPCLFMIQGDDTIQPPLTYEGSLQGLLRRG